MMKLPLAVFGVIIALGAKYASADAIGSYDVEDTAIVDDNSSEENSAKRDDATRSDVVRPRENQTQDAKANSTEGKKRKERLRKHINNQSGLVKKTNTEAGRSLDALSHVGVERNFQSNINNNVIKYEKSISRIHKKNAPRTLAEQQKDSPGISKTYGQYVHMLTADPVNKESTPKQVVVKTTKATPPVKTTSSPTPTPVKTTSSPTPTPVKTTPPPPVPEIKKTKVLNNTNPGPRMPGPISSAETISDSVRAERAKKIDEDIADYRRQSAIKFERQKNEKGRPDVKTDTLYYRSYQDRNAEQQQKKLKSATKIERMYRKHKAREGLKDAKNKREEALRKRREAVLLKEDLKKALHEKLNVPEVFSVEARDKLIADVKTLSEHKFIGELNDEKSKGFFQNILSRVNRSLSKDGDKEWKSFRTRLACHKEELIAFTESNYPVQITSVHESAASIHSQDSYNIAIKILDTWFNTKIDLKEGQKYFGNFNLADQKSILRMLKIAYEQAVRHREAIETKFKAVLEGLNHDGFFAAYNNTISGDLWNELKGLSFIGKVDKLIGAYRYDDKAQKYFNSDGKEVTKGEALSYLYANYLHDLKSIDLKQALEDLINDQNAASFNEKLKLLSIYEKMLIKHHMDYYEESKSLLTDLRLKLYKDMLKKEIELIEKYLNCDINTVDLRTEVSGEGLTIILGSMEKDEILKAPGAALEKLLGKENITYGDLAEYVIELNKQREVAILHGFDIKYDEYYQIIMEAVQRSGFTVRGNLIEERKKYVEEVEYNDETRLTAFLYASKHLIVSDRDDAASLFLVNALRTKDPEIILHALSFVDFETLRTIFSKEQLNVIAAINDIQDADAVIKGLTESLDGCDVAFRDHVDKEFLENCIEDTRQKDYTHERSIEEEHNINASKTAARKTSPATHNDY